MFNPLSPNLTEMSDEELTQRVNSLFQRVRTCQNFLVSRQLLSLLEETQLEQRRRAELKAMEMDEELSKLIQTK